MLLWYIFGVMTGLALLPVFSLIGRRARGSEESGHEKNVYEDQLRALEAEAERGLIGSEEMEAARVEVSRRLLAAADRQDHPAVPIPRTSWALVAFGCAGLVVLVGLGGYLALGRPDLVARAPAPVAPQTAAPARAEVVARLADVEAQLRADPENGTGWEEAATLYFELDRYKESTRAYASAVRILGETAERLGYYGEAMTQADGGIVSAAAKSVFERALALDPTLVQGRFYLALAQEQGGELDKAAEAWSALLRDAPRQAFWRPLVERRLAVVKARLGQTSTPPTATPPAGASARASAEDVGAARELSPDAREDTVARMVARLATRLETDGKDLDGWLMLMRSYMVLGRPEDAKYAGDSARRYFAGDAAALKRVEEAERGLGIGAQ